MNRSEETVIISRLGHKGDGIAPGPVFVPRALPGETVQGVVENGRMAAPRILSPVAERVRPPCRHTKTCGGCILQHASDDFVSRWKAGIVKEALAAQGLSAAMRSVVTSPPASRRRAVLAARRMKKGVRVGFHGLRSEEISEIHDCRLIHPELRAALPLVGELTRIGATRKAVLSVTLTLVDGGVDVAVSGGKPLDDALITELVECARGTGAVRLVWDGEVLASFSPARVRFGRAWVTLPPGAFLQATEEGEAALVASVREAVAGARSIADLFAGAGTFSLPLAETASVHAVEGNAALVRALDAGWRGADRLKQVSVEARDLFRRPLQPDELARFDAVVLDPPRAGAEAQIRAIAASRVARTALVSCNPVTFVRDARILSEAGFAIEWFDVVDQFRWSPHIEMVASLTRQ